MLNQLDLLDWKRRIFACYAEVRDSGEPAEAWAMWRRTRDELFASHPQSPIPEHSRDDFTGLDYFDYDPAFRVLGDVVEAEPRGYEIGASGGGTIAFDRFASVRFELNGEVAELELYWLRGYGGGLFLPFADSTSAAETYGAGRYLLDTVKGADLGTDEGGRLVLDFNFAYNPSCSYDPAWVCPLATPPNRLTLPVEAGERHESD
jgi:uncharacterized protein (DUF1684 family)